MTDRTPAAIGNRIAAVRLAMGLPQSEFAKGAGLTQHTCAGWETGERRPVIDAAIALTDAYGLTLDYLYKGDMSGLPYALAVKLRTG